MSTECLPIYKSIDLQKHTYNQYDQHMKSKLSELFTTYSHSQTCWWLVTIRQIHLHHSQLFSTLHQIHKTRHYSPRMSTWNDMNHLQSFVSFPMCSPKIMSTLVHVGPLSMPGRGVAVRCSKSHDAPALCPAIRSAQGNRTTDPWKGEAVKQWWDVLAMKAMNHQPTFSYISYSLMMKYSMCWLPSTNKQHWLWTILNHQPTNR